MIYLLLFLLAGVTAQIEEGKGFTVVCHELYVTGIWQKDLLGGTVRSISLIDTSCHNYLSNQTHVWITANFDKCGSTSSKTNQAITQENEASLTIANEVLNIERPKTYRYNMRCVFHRDIHVSHYVKSNTTVEVVKDVNISVTTKYDVSMDVFTSSSFLIAADRPITVTSLQPIYIGIKKGTNSVEIKFVVNKCVAKTLDDLNRQHTFLESKCPLDRSLSIVNQDNNQYNFHVDAFPLIQTRKSVYIQCTLYVCTPDATSPACTQQCDTSQSENGEAPLAQMIIDTETISYEDIQTCADISCPENGECKDLYPAYCVCNEGYILDTTTGNCSLPEENKSLFVNGLSLQINFVETFKNTSSEDFIRFAAEAEKLLMELFQSQGVTNIIGVRVLGMRNGSVLLDLQLIYAPNVTTEEVSRSFMKVITSDETQTSNFTKRTILKIQRDVTLSITQERIDPTKATLMYSDDNTLLYALVFTLTGALLITLVMSWVIRKNRITSKKTVKYTVNEPPTRTPEQYEY